MSANTTDPLARTVHGTNPQFLVEKILRLRIYENAYWKEHCFALTAETLVDKAVKLEYVGGTYSFNNKPTPFICLLLKLLQIQPDQAIVVEYINNSDYKYLRALGAMYMRLVGRPAEVYAHLEPLLNDYRKLARRSTSGWSITHMDEFVDELLTAETCCDIALPRLPKRSVLESTGALPPRVSALDDDLADAADADEGLEVTKEADGGGAPPSTSAATTALAIVSSAVTASGRAGSGDGAGSGGPAAGSGSYSYPMDRGGRAGGDGGGWMRPRSPTHDSSGSGDGGGAKAGGVGEKRRRSHSPPPRSHVSGGGGGDGGGAPAEGSVEYWNAMRAKLGLKPLARSPSGLRARQVVAPCAGLTRMLRFDASHATGANGHAGGGGGGDDGGGGGGGGEGGGSTVTTSPHNMPVRRLECMPSTMYREAVEAIFHTYADGEGEALMSERQFEKLVHDSPDLLTPEFSWRAAQRAWQEVRRNNRHTAGLVYAATPREDDASTPCLTFNHFWELLFVIAGSRYPHEGELITVAFPTLLSNHLFKLPYIRLPRRAGDWPHSLHVDSEFRRLRDELLEAMAWEDYDDEDDDDDEVEAEVEGMEGVSDEGKEAAGADGLAAHPTPHGDGEGDVVAATSTTPAKEGEQTGVALVEYDHVTSLTTVYTTHHEEHHHMSMGTNFAASTLHSGGAHLSSTLSHDGSMTGGPHGAADGVVVEEGDALAGLGQLASHHLHEDGGIMPGSMDGVGEVEGGAEVEGLPPPSSLQATGDAGGDDGHGSEAARLAALESAVVQWQVAYEQLNAQWQEAVAMVTSVTAGRDEAVAFAAELERRCVEHEQEVTRLAMALEQARGTGGSGDEPVPYPATTVLPAAEVAAAAAPASLAATTMQPGDMGNSSGGGGGSGVRPALASGMAPHAVGTQTMPLASDLEGVGVGVTASKAGRRTPWPCAWEWCALPLLLVAVAICFTTARDDTALLAWLPRVGGLHPTPAGDGGTSVPCPPSTMDVTACSTGCGMAFVAT